APMETRMGWFPTNFLASFLPLTQPEARFFAKLTTGCLLGRAWGREGLPKPASREEADEGAYRRWRLWRTGGGRLCHPQRGSVRPGHHGLRGGRADGWFVLAGRQCGDRLHPTMRFRLRLALPLYIRPACDDPLDQRSGCLRQR